MKTRVFVKPEEVELKLKDRINEEDFYDEDARIVLMDDDELSAEESGFMQGYDEEK